MSYTETATDSQLDDLLARLRAAAETLEAMAEEATQTQEEDHALVVAAEGALKARARRHAGASIRILRKRLDDRRCAVQACEIARASRRTLSELSATMEALGHTRAS
jgi:predicted transcriptional regulator